MHFQDDEEVSRLVKAFETCTIHPAEFRHHMHLAVALWYLKHFPFDEASQKIRQGIRRLAAAYGKTGYHETITLFWLEIVRRFLAHGHGREQIFVAANKLASECGNKNLIADYYSEATLGSAKARSEWVEPDLQSLNENVAESRAVASGSNTQLPK